MEAVVTSEERAIGWDYVSNEGLKFIDEELDEYTEKFWTVAESFA